MTGILLAMTMGLTAPPGPAGSDDAQKYGWHTDYAKALAEAKQRGKLLFVVFR
jgi:hypothetical protein